MGQHEDWLDQNTVLDCPLFLARISESKCQEVRAQSTYCKEHCPIFGTGKPCSLVDSVYAEIIYCYASFSDNIVPFEWLAPRLCRNPEEYVQHIVDLRRVIKRHGWEVSTLSSGIRVTPQPGKHKELCAKAKEKAAERKSQLIARQKRNREGRREEEKGQPRFVLKTGVDAVL